MYRRYVHLQPNQPQSGKSGGLFKSHALHHVQADVKFEGTLGVYQSSDKAVRKFCTNCGTPLVFQFVADAEKVRSEECLRATNKILAAQLSLLITHCLHCWQVLPS